jgi:hypothetical protein
VVDLKDGEAQIRAAVLDYPARTLRALLRVINGAAGPTG